MRVLPPQLTALMDTPACVRNICILAHVDHGKTSLSDLLLATNGIILPKLAGKVRYLDLRPDEQLRGITMELLAILLFFRVLRKVEGQDEPEALEHLINLIDLPGHIDFSSEVSTASRLCDGAVVVVDVVEGVCSQTVTVLRQLWTDNLKPVLVLNKIDRLVTELRLTPAEAYLHLAKVVEQVNSVIGSFFAGDRMQADLTWREALERLADAEYVERDDAELYFDPAKNNVVFASAIDGWGFTVSQAARFYSEKLGMKREALAKVLWGDFYLDAKNKKVLTSKTARKGMKPLFVQVVLENLWAVYEHTLVNRDQERLDKIVGALKLRLLPRDLRSKDSRALLHTVMSQWFPVSSAVLLTAVEQLGSPVDGQGLRVPLLLADAEVDAELKADMTACNREGLLCAYVSKMVSVPEADLPRNQAEALSDSELAERSRIAREASRAAAEAARENDEPTLLESAQRMTLDEFDDFGEFEEEEEEIVVPAEELIGVVRVYSGTLTVGMEVSVVGPKHHGDDDDEHITTTTITDLYLLMGRELLPVDHVPAGCIAGVGGLAGSVLKNGTLVDVRVESGLPNLALSTTTNPPIVRVAVEPVNPIHLDHVVRGLELLNRADPCVAVEVTPSGEHILMAAGELHLERCVKDLTERFAGVPIHVSEAMVPYRETITGEAGTVEAKVGPRGTATYDGVTLRVVPLPSPAVEYIERHQSGIKALMGGTASELSLAEFESGLGAALDSFCDVSQVAALGPSRCGPNLLVDHTGTLRGVFSGGGSFPFRDLLVHGFQLATDGGPLAGEPMQGVAVVVEAVDSDAALQPGRVITQTRDAIHAGFLEYLPRIMLATYECDIQATAEVLGKVYGVVHGRRGVIVSEEMKEGTPFFTITARIPVVEAFGFSEEIRKKTLGAALPQLVFAGFEALDMDPFWVPRTEAELEDLGEYAERENVARMYVDKVRELKGLFVERLVVKDAEKQRTLKKD